MAHILFICTGNYYRSRFAEALVRHEVNRWSLAWTASSRGLWRGPNKNPGPLSVYTQRELTRRGIAYAEANRSPLKLREPDLAAADVSIALDEAEHRPMMEAQFPGWADRITYWRVHDLHLAEADEALAAIAAHVEALIERWVTEAG
jgi:protein-tyrosine phosphatase